MSRRNVTIAVILVLALGVGFVVYGILTAPHKSTAPPKPVVVAAVAIPAHTKLVPAMVTTIQKPADQIEPGALVDPADAVGLLAMADIPEGAQLTPQRLARPALAPPGLQVAQGQRAITIGIDQVKGLAFLVKPGDHVDILASPPKGQGAAMAFAIVRDARVLAVAQQLENTSGEPTPSPAPGAPPPLPPQTVTVGVSPKEADLILAADLNGTIRLALRSPHEPARSMTAEAMIYPTPQPPPPPPPPPPGIPVVNGDKVESVKP